VFNERLAAMLAFFSFEVNDEIKSSSFGARGRRWLAPEIPAQIPSPIALLGTVV